MKFSDQMDFEFNELERKIQRLKLIEMKLNTLNVEGLEHDVAKIKSKLKNPNTISEVEREFNLLKIKISEKKEDEKRIREKARIAEEKKRKQEEREQRDLKQLRNEADEEIKIAKKSLENAENFGLPVREAKCVMDEARHAFESKFYKNAKNEAQQCIEFVNSAIKKHEEEQAHKEREKRELEQLRSDAVELIKSAKFSIEKAERLGTTVQHAREFNAKAQSAFDANDYSSAISYAQQSSDAAERLIGESKPSISIELPPKMKYNYWRHHNITISNNGTAHAKNITISFSKALETRELKTISQLNIGEQQTIQINIKPTEAGDVPIDYSIKFHDLQDRTYETKNTTTIQISTGTEATWEGGMNSIDIKRGFVVMENKDLRFGIRIKNISRYAIHDVDIILKYDREPFSLKGREIEHLGNIPNNKEKTAEFILSPLKACVHNSEISAVISYVDASGNDHTSQMHPKEVHCISPYLAEKPIGEGEFSKLCDNKNRIAKGVVFKGISSEELKNYLIDSSKNKRYVVMNSFINGIHLIYLSSEAKDKTFYLLTVRIRTENSLQYVGLIAVSNNIGGLNNFMDEVLDSLRHYVKSVKSAKEVENIENVFIDVRDSKDVTISLKGDAKGRDESYNYKTQR